MRRWAAGDPSHTCFQEFSRTTELPSCYGHTVQVRTSSRLATGIRSLFVVASALACSSVPGDEPPAEEEESEAGEGRIICQGEWELEHAASDELNGPYAARISGLADGQVTLALSARAEPDDAITTWIERRDPLSGEWTVVPLAEPDTKPVYGEIRAFEATGPTSSILTVYGLDPEIEAEFGTILLEEDGVITSIFSRLFMVIEDFDHLDDGRMVTAGFTRFESSIVGEVMIKRDSPGFGEYVVPEDPGELHAILVKSINEVYVAGADRWLARVDLAAQDWDVRPLNIGETIYGLAAVGDRVLAVGSQHLYLFDGEADAALSPDPIDIVFDAAWYTVHSFDDGVALLGGSQLDFGGGDAGARVGYLEADGTFHLVPSPPGSKVTSIWGPTSDPCAMWVITDAGVYTLVAE